MDRTKELGGEVIGKLMWRYYWPAFIGVMANALYNIVDRIFIGHWVGTHGLSGLTIVFPLMIVIMAFGMLIGIGTSVRISIFMGRGEKDTAERVLANGAILMVLASVFVSVLGFLIRKPLLLSFGATAQTYTFAQQYLDIVLVGAFFPIVGYSLNNVIRSEGNARIAMLSMLISALLNLALDALFVVVFKWGVKGAAWATVISQIVLFAWVLYHFLGGRSYVRFHARNFHLDKSIVLAILSIGMSSFTLQFAASVVQSIFNTRLVEYGGDTAVGAFGIMNSVVMLFFMVVIALNMASQPIVGFNYGARQYARVRKTLLISVKAATVISVCGFLLFELFPLQVVRLFNASDLELLSIGKHGLRIAVLAFPFVGFQIVNANYYQSIGKAKVAMLLTLLRQVGVLIPLLLILPRFFGLDGIWYAIPLSDMASAMLSAYFLYKAMRHLGDHTAEPY